MPITQTLSVTSINSSEAVSNSKVTAMINTVLVSVEPEEAFGVLHALRYIALMPKNVKNLNSQIGSSSNIRITRLAGIISIGLSGNVKKVKIKT